MLGVFWQWVKAFFGRGWMRIASSALAGGLLVLLVGAITDWSTQANANDPDSVVRDWSGTIRMLGVEPSYPSEEDLDVGDLFAAIVENDPTKLDAIPLTARAIKLVHIDMDSH